MTTHAYPSKASPVEMALSSREPRVSVIVPIHDEEETVQEVVTETVAALAPAAVDFEIILVDDGSRDRSWSRIRDVSAAESRVRGIRLRSECGKAAALAAGVAMARGRIVVTMDGDLQDDPAEIPRFLDKLAAGADLVSGWKRERRDPRSKTLPSRLFNGVTRRLTGLDLHDVNCGFKAARIEVFRQIPLYGELHRYIPVFAENLGFRIEEIPVTHRPRAHGVSKYGWERYWRGAVDLLTVLALTRFGRRPGHLFGGLALLSGAFGFLTVVALIAVRLATGAWLGGAPLLVTAVLLLGLSAHLMTLGLWAEIMVNRSGGFPPAPLVTETTDSHDRAAPATAQRRLA